MVFLHKGSFFLTYRLRLHPGQDYEQNGVGEKRGRVRLNQLSGRKVGGKYGARKAEIGGIFLKERESAGVASEKSRISRGFGKQRKDRGASGRVLGCLTVKATRNSIFIQQSRPVLPTPLALPFLIALACLCTVHLFLCWQPCFKVHSGKQKHIYEW